GLCAADSGLRLEGDRDLHSGSDRVVLRDAHASEDAGDAVCGDRGRDRGVSGDSTANGCWCRLPGCADAVLLQANVRRGVWNIGRTVAPTVVDVRTVAGVHRGHPHRLAAGPRVSHVATF